MTQFDVRDILDTFSVIVDTREHDGDKFEKRLADMDTSVERAVLDYGDYAAQCIFPDGSKLYNTDARIFPRFSVERKMGLDELAMCFGRQRERFTREFERAKDNGARLWLLVEGASYEKIRNHNYRSKLNPKAFMASIIAYQVRYDIRVVMCSDRISGHMIREILYRELKEYLDGLVDE